MKSLYRMNDVQHVVRFRGLGGDDGVHRRHQAVTVTRGGGERTTLGDRGGENNVRRQLIGRPFRVAAPARQCDWLPGVMGLHDGSSVLIAERQKVEEVSEVEQRVHVVLKRVMRHTCERHARRWLFPNRRWFGGRIEVWLEGLKSQPKDTEFRGPMAAT